MTDEPNKFHRDLLGDPISPRWGKKGRPRHTATDALRAQVAKLHREGRSQPEISRAIGITEPTLRRHYPDEIESKSQAWRHWENERGQADG